MSGRRALAALAAPLVMLAGWAAAVDKPSRFLDQGADGRLVYAVDARGDRIPDFSHCGYGGGGVAIPDTPARVVVAPAAGDEGPQIQAALDHVAGLPADARGVRGAVVLLAGRHEVAGQLRIAASGVVLRGAGDGPGGTTLVAAGVDRRTLIVVRGEGAPEPAPGGPHPILDDYVPVGATRLRLAGGGGLRPGESIAITRPSPAEWIAALGMDRFAPGEKGGYLNWRPGRMDLRSERVVTAVDGDTISFDAPLTTALDAKLGGGSVAAYNWPGRIAHVGVEDLRLESPHDARNPKDENHSWIAVGLDKVEDAWVRRVAAVGFAGSAVSVMEGARRVTVQDCVATAPVSELAGYRRHTFYTAGQQTLFRRCRSEGGRHDFGAGYLAAGPNAFSDCSTSDAAEFSGPIESWASGVLYDKIMMDGGGLALTNREIDGNGVGWAAANCVLYQCTASVITCRNPPGAHNWAIGCWGQFVGDGHWQMPNEFVKPASLYEGQLADRLGPVAIAALGRGSPPPVPADARPVSEVESVPPRRAVPEPGRPLAIRDGWITVGGELLVGGRVGTSWWRGQILPSRADEFGIGVTRFVPGREGPGATDDLDILADSMARTGKAALEHNYGLWYDRRRDDHQMVRRPDGGAWPPFYELPWARSGRGAAWDGLSRYDLEAFNPWYFGRLDRFAALCDRKGLALVHHAYFQHNILEAGAHWADFPWRPANSVQATGFAEPPPYAGGKRIFMADDFYDVDHPERRRLHRLYIRHCLDALGGHPNVLFLAGEEFTGPLHFMRFWVDTVAEWGRETGRDVIVGLGATKDVQDAILADPVRGPTIDLIQLKYWWYAADGSLYAPPGGQNLAPRQQQREWRGSRKRSAEQVARQVREYRLQYPDKAILFSQDGVRDGWAVLAAGGSIADVPSPSDPRLRAALPRMRPAGPADPLDRVWALADPGRDYFLYAGPGATIRLDLAGAPGPFRAHRVRPADGRVEPPGPEFAGGKVVDLPAALDGPTVFWVTRAEPDPRPGGETKP